MQEKLPVTRPSFLGSWSLMHLDEKGCAGLMEKHHLVSMLQIRMGSAWFVVELCQPCAAMRSSSSTDSTAP